MLKSIRTVAAAAVLALGANAANAALLLYEPFAYTAATGPNGAGTSALVGQSPDGTHTWVEAFNAASYATSGVPNGVGDDANIVNPSLAYTGLPASTGNRVQFGQTGTSYRIGFGGSGNPSSITDGTIYYSMLLNITDLNFGKGTSADTGGRQIAIFSNGSTTSTSSNLSVGFGALWAKLASSTTSNSNQQYYLGVSKTQGTNARVFDDSNPSPHLFGPNDTVLVVVGYSRDAANEDVAKLWIDPDMSTLGAADAPAPTLTTPLGTADADPASNQVLSGFGLFQNSTVSTGTFGNTGVNADEIRIATTWAEVTGVPEPTSLSAAVIGGIAMLGRRRRRHA